MVYNKAGYAGVFGIGFAILAIDFIMRLLLIEKKTAKQYEDGIEAEEHNEVNGEDGESGHEAGEEDPLIRKEEGKEYKIPPDQPKLIKSLPIVYCLKDARLLTALLLAFVQATLLSTFDATIPTEAQELFNFNSLKAGLLFIALSLPYLLFGPIAGWAVDRYGTKPAAVVGFGYLVPALVSLRLAHRGDTAQIVEYCALLALCGVGLAVIGSPSIVEASFVVQKYDTANPDFFGANGPYATLYAINSMVFSAGLTLGPLLSGLLREAIGYGNMNATIAALCLVTSVLSFINIGGKPRIFRYKGV